MHLTYLKVPSPAIPIPAFDVPYAAPTVERVICYIRTVQKSDRGRAQLTAAVTPANLRSQRCHTFADNSAHPKKGAHGGHSSDIVYEGCSGMAGRDVYR